jgi:hypothetical protein
MQGLRAKLNKGEIATMNSKTMATMASQLSSMSNVYDAFLLRKMDINHEGKKNKVKINNLNMAKDLSVIPKKKFRTKVRSLLEL